MLAPASARPFKIRATSCRPMGSKPFIGSSSTSNSGRCNKAWPSLTRCFMPLEYWPMRRSQCSRGSLTWSSTASARAAASLGATPESKASPCNQSLGLSSLGRASPSGQKPIRRSKAGLFQGRWPKTVNRPELGLSWPVMIWISVLLPAPFGPTKPVNPGRTSKLTLFNPITMPYQRLNSSAWMRAVILESHVWK